MVRIAPAIVLLLSGFLLAQSSLTTDKSTPDADSFMRAAEVRLDDAIAKASRAGWVHETFITDDTEAIAAGANEQILATTTELVNDAKQFEGARLSPVLQRKFMLLIY